MEKTEAKKYDVFVIGSGIAGQTVAKECVKAGQEVAIADKREFGGTCSNRGCDPKKVLLAAIEIRESAENLLGKGVQRKLRTNWKQQQKYKRKFTKSIPSATEKDLKKLDIDLYHQSPKFLDTHRLSVEGKTVQADKIVIATGYEPRPLDFKGSTHLKTSDDFLNLKKLPKHITFIGGGYVGMEFAHMAVRSGAKVTVIESGECILPVFDADLVTELITYSKRIGIAFIFKADTTAVKKLRKNFKLTYTKDGKTKTLKSRAVFNTAGRIPAISELDLEKGNIAFNEKGIATNAFLQSKTNPDVYACGDVSDNGLPLTPLSGREGYVVAENLIKGNHKKLDIPVIPSVAFTLPNMASVGYSEEEAKARYKNVIVKHESVPGWFNARRMNAPVYTYKIILNQRTNEIVGAHLLGPEAGETINIFAMAINMGMTANQIKQTVFTYPSWANDVKSMV